MVKEFFNLPANPFRDKREPVFLTVGDCVAALAVAAAITGGAYGTIKYGDDVIDFISTSLSSASAAEQGEAMSMEQTPKIG